MTEIVGDLIMDRSKPKQTWTVAEAKARLSEPRKPLGQWLIDNMPRGTDLEIPDRHESGRESPFILEAT